MSDLDQAILNRALRDRRAEIEELATTRAALQRLVEAAELALDARQAGHVFDKFSSLEPLRHACTQANLVLKGV